jgi:aminopeptidase
LYDENAACHIALGASYPTNIKDGSNLSREVLSTLGSNNSSVHVDFMFGNDDMKIVGTSLDGKEIKIFENGNFVF